MDAYGTDEVMINLMMPGESARLNAINAISDAMDEIGSAPAAAAEQEKAGACP
ncbi:hypothetical protein D3C85_1777360 [compost metagenome]